MNHHDIERLAQPSSQRTKLTRVVVVPTDGSGAQEFWADEFDIAYCDSGRTLKLFATGTGESARAQRSAELAKGFAHDSAIDFNQ